MNRPYKTLLGAALLAVGASGCSDFLSGEGVDTNPNRPSVATRDQLFVAVQAGQFGQQSASVAQFSCLTVQHCGGVGNYVETYGNYVIDNSSFDFDFFNVYIGGGLIDIRRIITSAETDGDRVYAGIAKIWEALTVSFAADNWGDIPYTEAVGENQTPAFDAQMVVYDALIALLDEAIADLSSAAGPGPGPIDLVYGGNTTKWTEAANSLKARLHMHTAERLGGPAYTDAIAAATAGISVSANDWTTKHSTATSERNMWYQFSLSTFGQYLKSGATLVNLMEARSDPRLPSYFTQVAPGDYRGFDVNNPTAETFSEVATPDEDTRITQTFPQPILTYEETQLILAEAYFETSNVPQATIHLNNVRVANGLLPVGVATRQLIAEEYYIELFQNIEAWQVWKRTCYPNLDPAGTATMIPARLYYGQREENANPNTPSVGEQDANGGVAEGTGSTASPGRNPNDPPGGTVNDAAACLGQ
jgi:hypothetical protein